MRSFFGKKREGARFTFQAIPSVYVGGGRDGDFSWMEKQPEHADTLFIFNDNEEQFLAFVRGETLGFSAGGGNAAIRPLRKLDPPRAAGVPTGRDQRGYQNLDGPTKAVIDQSLAVIQELVNTGRFKRLIFSKDKHRETLGVYIYGPEDEVKQYIYDQLKAMRPR